MKNCASNLAWMLIVLPLRALHGSAQSVYEPYTYTTPAGARNPALRQLNTWRMPQTTFLSSIMLLGGGHSPANWLFIRCLAFILALSGATAEAADPVVSNIQATQRIGTKLVDITYDLAVKGSVLTIDNGSRIDCISGAQVMFPI